MKLSSTILLASALSLAPAPAANAASASSQAQVGDLVSKITIGLNNNEAGQSTSVTIEGSHELTNGAKPPQALDLEVRTAPGTSANPGIAGTCDFSELKTTGSCPASTRLGRGSARIRVDTGGLGSLATDDVVAYKIASSNCDPGSTVCGAIHASESVTGVVTDIVVSVVGNPPRVIVHDFSLPTVLGIVPVNIFTKVVVDSSMTVRKNGRKRTLYVLNNPKRCRGTWDYFETRNFEGVGPATNTVQIPCRKASKKRKKR